MKMYIVLFCVFACFFSCSYEKLTEYNENESYIYFSKSIESDSIMLSFFFHAGDQVKLPFEMSVSGLVPKQDIIYTVSAYGKGTDADPKLYDIPQSFTFRAGQTKDTAYIVFNNAPELKTQSYRLTLQIDAGKDYLLGPKVKRMARIWLMDKPSRPDWWEEGGRVEIAFLGKYSVKKYRLFMEVTGVSDLSEKNSSQKRLLALRFKKYLKEEEKAGRPVMDEENNEKMTVTVMTGL